MRPLLRAATLPVRDVMRGLARALTRPLDLVWILGGTAAAWWVYVPLHELLHALACRAAGGRVWRLEIAAAYGGRLLAHWLPWVSAGGDYAGRLAGFDTGGSDAVYLATALGPFVLTLLPGVWALRRAARAARPFLVGLALPCALAPFLSLTGDAYEIGSILVTRLAPWRAASPLLRGDDVLRVAAGLAGGRASLWMGLAAASLVGVLWAFAIYGLGGVVATALGESAPSGEEPSPTPRSATVRSSTANCQ